MGGFSLWHWLIVLVVVLVLFGAGRLPQVAGDLAKGIRAFRKGLDEDPTPNTRLPPWARPIKSPLSHPLHRDLKAGRNPFVVLVSCRNGIDLGYEIPRRM